MSHQSVGAQYKEEPAAEPSAHPGHPHHQSHHQQQPPPVQHQPLPPAANQHPHSHPQQQPPPQPQQHHTQQHGHPQQHQQHQQHQQQHPAHPRPTLPQQQSQPQHQQQPPQSAYSSPHPQSPFAASSGPLPGAPVHHTQTEIPYFAAHPSPYGTPGSTGSSYTPHAPENPDMMAAHTMNRPTQYPPISFHTPQSNPSSSVASPTTTDHRSVYSTQPMSNSLYGYQQAYPQMPAAPPSYPGQPQHQHMAGQPLLMSHTPGQTMPPARQHPQQVAPTPNPGAKVPQQAPLHKTSPANPGTTGGKSQGGGSVNPNAAPGPIPATTPRVVRQDTNGVQWIMFEYSRDRVKMEYTIRCDVESVQVDSLSPEFKTENCVYPRACCGKDQYRGNRLVYETECNSVGWALAQLNPALRGKRGLIQRAVDSWRNSNQDPRLRSRRVRRMAKLNTRKAAAQGAQQNQMAAPAPNGALPSTSNIGLGLEAPPNMMPTPAPQLQHHHHQPAGDAANPQVTTNGEQDMGAMLQQHHHHNGQQQYNGMENQMASGANSRSTSGHLSPAVGNGEFTNGQTHHHHNGPTNGNDIRPRHVFHNYPASYPTENVSGTSIPPSMHDGMDQLGQSSSASAAVTSSTPPARGASLFGEIPEHKRRKFILVDDPHRGSRVRVRVTLDQVHMQEIPDSYRKTNSVFPRSFISSQTELDQSTETEIRTQITVPTLDGNNMTVETPRPSARKRQKEHDLNELGYRMSWSQSRVFAGRTMFLQRALDVYRNKTRSTMMAAGSDVVATAPHLETRVGKRKWSERSRRSRDAGSSA